MRHVSLPQADTTGLVGAVVVRVGPAGASGPSPPRSARALTGSSIVSPLLTSTALVEMRLGGSSLRAGTRMKADADWSSSSVTV